MMMQGDRKWEARHKACQGLGAGPQAGADDLVYTIDIDTKRVRVRVRVKY
jgi:hypothetical protein